MVEVVAAKVCVAIGRLNLKHAVAKFKNRDIECAAAKVEHSNFLFFVRFVETICKGGRCRLVHNTANFKARNLAGLFCGLALRVVEVCRNSDNGFSHFLSEVVFCCFLHFLKNHSGDFLRSVVSAVDVNLRHIVLANHFVRHTLDFVLHLVA